MIKEYLFSGTTKDGRKIVFKRKIGDSVEENQALFGKEEMDRFTRNALKSKAQQFVSSCVLNDWTQEEIRFVWEIWKPDRKNFRPGMKRTRRRGKTWEMMRDQIRNEIKGELKKELIAELTSKADVGEVVTMVPLAGIID